MPGIFGVVDLGTDSPALAAERREIASTMAAAMCYERDYVVDLISPRDVTACAGWVGRPLRSDRSYQAAVSEPRTTLLTAGEPVVALEARIDQPCHTVGSGAGRLTAHLRQHGIDGLKDVDGTFAGFWIDHDRHMCVLFNDRYGIERLFLHNDGDRMLFASEAKAILAAAPSARAIDPAGLTEWLSCGATIGARSLFQDVEILAGGTALTFVRGRRPVRTQYFDRATLEQLPELSPQQFLDRFDRSLATAVHESLITPPSAAISLTGGFDSRLVLASMDAPPHSVPCYTFGSMYRPTGDVSAARAVAAACGQSHYELKLDAPFLARIDEFLREAVYVSDGYMGLPGSAELYVNRQARSLAPARVTGNWGGELMRGVRAFKFRIPRGNFIRPDVVRNIEDAGDAFRHASGGHPLSFTLFQQAPHQAYGRYAIERSQVVMRSPFLAAEVVSTLYQAPLATRTSPQLVEKVLARRPQLLNIATDTGSLGRGPGAWRALRRTYRKALIKTEYLTSHGAPNWMAALSSRIPMLETAWLGRNKFHHFPFWIRHELAPFVRETLTGGTTERLEQWFDMHRVAAMVEEHIAGRANYTEEIDKVLTVAELHRTLLSGQPRSDRSFSTADSGVIYSGHGAR